MIEKRKRGRPLGSGVKNYCALGCRLTEEEYLLIQESLKRLRKMHKTNSKIILSLFKKYGKALGKKEIRTILEERYNDKINESRIRATER